MIINEELDTNSMRN